MNSPNGFGWFRSRRAGALLIGATVLVLALLATFAVALSQTQSDSKRALEARVHGRAVLAGALINSIFSSATTLQPKLAKELTGPTLSAAFLNAQKGEAAYLAVVTPDGRTLAASSGFTAQASTELTRSGPLALVRAGKRYGLGDIVPYEQTNVINLAVGVKMSRGERVLVEGFSPTVVDALLTGELRRIPGPSGSQNLIVDGNGTIIDSSTASLRVGHHFGHNAALAALGASSGQIANRYYEQQPLADSTWRIVLSAPAGAMFASVNGLHHWVPWLILIAFGIVALLAIGLGWRVLHSAERDLASANAELAAVNRELAGTNAQLEHRAAELARSNAELDRFASIASHDLQEPLRKVRTFTERLSALESEHLSERGADYLMRANRAAERMQNLIQDLLRFSRVTTKPRPFVPVDLNATVGAVLDDLSVEIEESDASLSIGPLPTISGDSLQLHQLLLNLISNAVKFRQAGVKPEVAVNAELDGQFVMLTVSDNGIGFEPRYSDRIFGVFERLNGRQEYPGTGIGLALCQKIVARHGGQISVEATPGAGATFTVILPVEHHEQQTHPEEIKEQAGAIH